MLPAKPAAAEAVGICRQHQVSNPTTALEDSMTRRLCLLLLLVLLTSTSMAAPQLSGRREVEAEVSRLWDRRAFDELDTLEKSLRSTNATSASGWPMLFMFYQALDSLPVLEGEGLASLNKAEADTDKWLAKSPSSNFGRFLKIDFLMARAWRARGHGYANTVSAAQWKEFSAYMDEASEYLTRQKASLSSNPNWYSAWLDIANATSWPKPEYDELLAEAVKRHGRYLPILIQVILHRTPKWGGSYREMDDFIASSTLNIAPPERDELYARQYSYAFEQSLFPDRARSKVSCERWLRGYEEILRKYSTSYNVNHAAFAAVACADKPVAARYLKQLGAQSPDLSVWGADQDGAVAFFKARSWATGER
jgi:hypothetical protein